MKPARFDYRRPAGLGEAIDLLAAGDGEARLLAGGQSLGPMLNLRLAQPELLIDISRLPELRSWEVDDHGLTVGAAVCHAAFEDGDAPDVANGLLAAAAGDIAYRAVRNRGTIGGSLAHADPAADWPPVMMALGAVLTVRGADGTRGIPAAAFIESPLTTALRPDEIVESVRIPRLSPTARWGRYKIARKPGDFADSLAVIVVDRDRDAVHAALAGPGRAPVLLEETAGVIAADAVELVRDAAAADMERTGFRDPDDDYAFNLHRVAVARAAEALSP